MSSDLSSGSYLWKRNSAGGQPDPSQAVRAAARRSAQSNEPDTEAARHIWRLLETPHTVESLCRVLTNDHPMDRASCERQVEAALKSWIEADLIELSPDS